MSRLVMLAGLLLAPLAPVGAQCLLCAKDGEAAAAAPTVPLDITVDAELDFSRAAQIDRNGKGTIDLDERTGQRTVRGLRDLGGVTLLGRVRVTGEPRRRLRITLPPALSLTASDGSIAEVSQLRINMAGDATLDAFGHLEFAFGGRLTVANGSAGDFRGRIPITIDYQ